MTPDKLIDSLTIRSPLIEVSANGWMAMTTLIILTLMVMCTRLWLRRRH
jgi:hypothetical protein